jgi:5-methylcytosine-specific restriction protein A
MSVQKNPTWTRDELILALDVYFTLNIAHVTARHPDIIALSELLNDLPIHSPSHENYKFRNPPGVHMKLRNFVRFDNRYSRRGLQRGGKLEEAIWKEFAENRARLHTTAKAIKENYRALPRSENLIDEENIEASFQKERFYRGFIIFESVTRQQ